MDEEDKVDEVETPIEKSDAPDVSVFEAKIAALESELAAKEIMIAELTAAVDRAKAENYDLLKSVPTNDDGIDVDTELGEDVDLTTDYTDLFE